MARSPLELYDRLVAASLEALGEAPAAEGASSQPRASSPPGAAEGASSPPEAAGRATAALRRWLQGPRDGWPDAVEGLIEDAGVSAGYVTRHLLSIRGFRPDVVAALRVGLPLRVARLVNGLTALVDRELALAPLWQALDPGAERGVLLPRGVADQVERTARRLSASPPQRGGLAAAPSGWLRSAVVTRAPARLTSRVWIYPAPSAGARQAESLPADVVEALIALYLPNGGKLVDVTAGSGTIGLAAREFGIESWSGDTEPGAGFVHRVDARFLHRFEGVVGMGLAGAADMLVVHPPTHAAWLARQPDSVRAIATVEGYLDEVAEMLAGSLFALAEGGAAVMITRPVRAGGRVSLVTSHLLQVMEESGLRVVAYHLAVSADGREDWHVLIGVP